MEICMLLCDVHCNVRGMMNIVMCMPCVCYYVMYNVRRILLELMYIIVYAILVADVRNGDFNFNIFKYMSNFVLNICSNYYNILII